MSKARNYSKQNNETVYYLYWPNTEPEEIPGSEFESDAEAIQFAQTTGATLIKETTAGGRTNRTPLYMRPIYGGIA